MDQVKGAFAISTGKCLLFQRKKLASYQ